MAGAYFVLLLTVLAAVAASTFEVPSSISEQSREKRETPGGIEERDPNDPEYHELAKESYEKYLNTLTISEPYIAKYIIVTRATYQVVSGTSKVIDFIVRTVFGGTKTCNSEIWEQPWLDKKEIKVSCV